MDVSGVETGAGYKAAIVPAIGAGRSQRLVGRDEEMHLPAGADGDALGTDGQSHRLIVI